MKQVAGGLGAVAVLISAPLEWTFELAFSSSEKPPNSEASSKSVSVCPLVAPFVPLVVPFVRLTPFAASMSVADNSGST